MTEKRMVTPEEIMTPLEVGTMRYQLQNWPRGNWDSAELLRLCDSHEALRAEVRRLVLLDDPLSTLERLVNKYTTPEIGAYCQLNWRDGVVSVLWVKGAFDEAPRFHYRASPGKHGTGETDRDEACALLAGKEASPKAMPPDVHVESGGNYERMHHD